MAALPATERFFAPEISKAYFLPAIAAATMIPTRAEIDAGTDLTDEIADLSGWAVSSGMINTPDLGHRFISQIGGRTSVEASTITFYASQDGNDVREVLPRGTTGFIVFADQGDAVGLPADVFPVQVTSLGKVRSTGDQAFQLTVSFAIRKPPAEDIALPAVA